MNDFKRTKLHFCTKTRIILNFKRDFYLQSSVSTIFSVCLCFKGVEMFYLTMMTSDQFYFAESWFQRSGIIYLNRAAQIHSIGTSQAIAKLDFNNISYEIVAMPQVIHYIYIFVCIFILNQLILFLYCPDSQYKDHKNQSYPGNIVTLHGNGHQLRNLTSQQYLAIFMSSESDYLCSWYKIHVLKNLEIFSVELSVTTQHQDQRIFAVTEPV